MVPPLPDGYQERHIIDHDSDPERSSQYLSCQPCLLNQLRSGSRLDRTRLRANLLLSSRHHLLRFRPPLHPDLLAVPRRQFRAVSTPRLEGVEVYRTEKKVFGRTHSVLVTFNQKLLDGQLQGLTTSLNQARRKLQQQLQRWREGQEKGKAPGEKTSPDDLLGAVPQADLILPGSRCAPRSGT